MYVIWLSALILPKLLLNKTLDLVMFFILLQIIMTNVSLILTSYLSVMCMVLDKYIFHRLLLLSNNNIHSL
jgi:hypothetical protein